MEVISYRAAIKWIDGVVDGFHVGQLTVSDLASASRQLASITVDCDGVKISGTVFLRRLSQCVSWPTHRHPVCLTSQVVRVPELYLALLDYEGSERIHDPQILADDVARYFMRTFAWDYSRPEIWIRHSTPLIDLVPDFLRAFHFDPESAPLDHEWRTHVATGFSPKVRGEVLGGIFEEVIGSLTTKSEGELITLEELTEMFLRAQDLRLFYMEAGYAVAGAAITDEALIKGVVEAVHLARCYAAVNTQMSGTELSASPEKWRVPLIV